MGRKLGFECELRDRPIQGGIVERLFGTSNTQVLAALPGYISKEEGGAERAEKEACFTLEYIDKMLAGYFCDDYNHQPYPKDPRDTRFERWFRGMGNKLPMPLNTRALDICLMKEAQRGCSGARLCLLREPDLSLRRIAIAARSVCHVEL